MNHKKISQKNSLIITDDVHLEFGYLRMRKQGSDGGHNGLKDIQERLGNNQYARLRVGIGADYNKGRQADFVLSPWSANEENPFPSLLTVPPLPFGILPRKVLTKR